MGLWFDEDDVRGKNFLKNGKHSSWVAFFKHACGDMTQKLTVQSPLLRDLLGELSTADRAMEKRQLQQLGRK